MSPGLGLRSPGVGLRFSGVGEAEAVAVEVGVGVAVGGCATATAAPTTVRNAAAAQLIWARRRKLATMRRRSATMERDYKPGAMAVDYNPATGGSGVGRLLAIGLPLTTGLGTLAAVGCGSEPLVCTTAWRRPLPDRKNLGQPRVRRQPRSKLGRWPLGRRIGVVSPRVHVTLVLHLAGCASQFEWRRPGPKPRVRSADPRQRQCDPPRRSSRPRPDQESPIDPAQAPARGQTTPPLARPLRNQPSRLVDGVPARKAESLPRLQAINPPAPTKTRKLRLFRQTRSPRTGTAMGLQSAIGLQLAIG